MGKIRWGSKEAREIARFAEERGFRVGVSCGNHLRLFDANGRVVMHTGQNIGGRNIHNAKAQIKRVLRSNKGTQK